MTSQENTPHQVPAPNQQLTSGLAISSLVVGVVSVSVPAPFLGVTAIILGVIALKRKHPNRGLSIAGIVTGSINTLISLIVATAVILLILLAASSGEGFYEYEDQWPSNQTDIFEPREA